MVSEYCTEKAGSMLFDILLGIFLRIPSHIHEELDRIFHRFQVTHIQNPHTLYTMVISQRELFKHLLCLSHIKPLAITRCSHIVHMVVEAPSTRMLAFLCIRHSAHISPVIITQQNQDIVGHTHTGIIVVEHFFIQCPHLSRLIGRLTRNLLDNLTLILNDTLQQLGIGLSTHCFVTVATHTDGHHILSTFHALDTLTEELVKLLWVLIIVPRSPLSTLTRILLMVTSHRLMVRGTHDDTHIISSLRVLRVVSIECPSPHGRPQHVTTKTKNQFKDFSIETMVTIISAKRILYP